MLPRDLKRIRTVTREAVVLESALDQLLAYHDMRPEDDNLAEVIQQVAIRLYLVNRFWGRSDQ